MTTKDFNEKVLQEVLGKVEFLEYQESGYQDVDVEVKAGGYNVFVTACVYVRMVDYSFSHGFGVENTEPSYEFERLDSLKEVTIFDSEGNEIKEAA